MESSESLIQGSKTRTALRFSRTPTQFPHSVAPLSTGVLWRVVLPELRKKVFSGCSLMAASDQLRGKQHQIVSLPDTLRVCSGHSEHGLEPIGCSAVRMHSIWLLYFPTTSPSSTLSLPLLPQGLCTSLCSEYSSPRYLNVFLLHVP